MVSLIIPTNKTNSKYTNALLNNINSLNITIDYEVILEENSKVTLGENYNNAVNKAQGDKIILLHNDMILSQGFVELMDKHIKKNRITTYTRIEPPIYKDTYPGKILKDCGSNIENFSKEEFENLWFKENLINGGSQLFFGCLKEDYIGVDGKTFKIFCEDDDIHKRYKLLGFEHKVSSAYVYHFVSKTSRTNPNSSQIEQISNKNYIRKWGSKSFSPKYDIGIKIKGGTSQLLEILEPWCSNILLDDEMQVITTHYIDNEQPHTTFNLKEKIKTTPFDNLENDVIVEIDQNTFTQQDFKIIQQLPQIIQDSGEIGKFEIGNLKIKIDVLEDYKEELIFINNT
jgi:hypothetical protein